LRATRALVLLAGFYLIGIGLIVLLVGADALVIWGVSKSGIPVFAAGKLLVLPLLLCVPVVRGMVAVRRKDRGGTEDGLPVTEADQPALWALVRDLATRVGTRPPREIVLVGAVNAAVTERARLLGLLPGPRRLYLGVPLLVGLTEEQLAAVLAHELGHYSGRDTRLAGLTMRGRAAVFRTVEEFRKRSGSSASGSLHRSIGKLYLGYGRFSLRATQAVARRQELAADRISATVAGRGAAASALRETAVLDGAFDFYVHRFAAFGWEDRMLPPQGEFFGGLRHLLAAPGRRERLAALRAELPEEKSSPYESHPPTAERVKLIEALPDDGRGPGTGGRPGTALILDPARTFAAVEAAALVDDAAATMRHLPWEELAREAGAARVRRGTAELVKAASLAGRPLPADPPGALLAFLDAIDAGQLWEIGALLPKSEQARYATGRAAREFARPQLTRGLGLLLATALLADGRARWCLDWDDEPHLAVPAWAEPNAPALAAAVADRPDTAPLRALLAGADPYEAESAPEASADASTNVPGNADPAGASPTASANPPTPVPAADASLSASATPGDASPTANPNPPTPAPAPAALATSAHPGPYPGPYPVGGTPDSPASPAAYPGTGPADAASADPRALLARTAATPAPAPVPGDPGPERHA
jgi:Zn-dependent protease with chaperone function